MRTINTSEDFGELFLTESLRGEERRTKYMDAEYRKQMIPSLRAVPYSFTWNCTDGELGPFVVQVSEKKDFSESAPILDVTPEDEREGNRADFVNFLLGRTYYWRVEGVKDGKKQMSKTGTFTTDSRPPRIIELPKVGNTRDIGGWTGLDGRKVRQGMIYRSNGLNYNSPDRHDKAIENATGEESIDRASDGLCNRWAEMEDTVGLAQRSGGGIHV